MLILIKSNIVKKKIIREGFCMCCKSKDNLQVSINLLSNPTYLCSKCISDYDSWKKKKEIIITLFLTLDFLKALGSF